MRTYDQIHADAISEPAFSNGTEAYAWTDNWCDTCFHDRSARVETHPDHPCGCPIFAVALIEQQTPVEWIEQRDPETGSTTTLGDTYHCTEYSPDDDWPDDPPPPRWNPEQPGQLSIFDEMLDQQLPTILTQREDAHT